MYLYETHCHTAAVSACSALSAGDIVELYTRNGYAGVFITDHFLNGNTTVRPDLAYAARIHAFCQGYEEVRKRAAGKLQVFFGLEYSYGGTDILIYGWDEAALQRHEELMEVPFADMGDYCRQHGLLAVHAHPFREADYIDYVKLSSKIERVETYNAARSELCNRLGTFYAGAYGKLPFGGSDLHTRTQGQLSGMGFSERLTSEQDFIDRLRRGEGTVLHVSNALAE